MRCRFCCSPLDTPFLDLGFAPPSNAYLKKQDLSKAETTYPLRLHLCQSCFLVQTEDYARKEELFTEDYAYFSSTSSSWLKHASDFVSKIIPKLQLTKESFVVEIASNDGYLLKNFIPTKIPCLGIEPTQSTREACLKLGIETIKDFFGRELALNLLSKGRNADLIIGNNVFAHVPDINDFTGGLKTLLKQGSTITLEFPHLLELLKYTQFDTVYHEHYSYFSLFTVQKIFKAHGLKIIDVEKLTTHGGSLRVYGCHESDPRDLTSAVGALLKEEVEEGLQKVETYLSFQEKVTQVKNGLLKFLLEKKMEGKRVAAYGAAAKGNTLLNYAGIKKDLISFVSDLAPSKQGKYLPGSHLPIRSLEDLEKEKPDSLLILPWNLKEEIAASLDPLKKQGCRFFVAVPELKEI